MRLWLFAVAIMSAQPGLAHDWYDPKCCGGQDCHPVPCDQLSEDSKGNWHWGPYTFYKNAIEPSKDSKCHVCIHGGYNPICVYIQQGS